MTALRPFRRTLWILAGFGFVALAVVGVLLPVVPSTPFAIGAAACFARSSPALERWLLEHRWFGPSIHAWRENGAIPAGVKLVSLCCMAVSGVGLTLTAPPAVAIGGGVVLAGSAAFIATRPHA